MIDLIEVKYNKISLRYNLNVPKNEKKCNSYFYFQFFI